MEKIYEPINIYCGSCGAPAKFDIEGQVYRCAFCGGVTGIREPLAEKQGFRQAHRARMEAAGVPAAEGPMHGLRRPGHLPPGGGADGLCLLRAEPGPQGVSGGGGFPGDIDPL